MARITRSSPCPMFTHINWLLKSRYRFPSGVQNQQPFAPAIGIGSIAACADHSKSVCFLVRSTMVWPLRPATAVSIVFISFSISPGSRPRLREGGDDRVGHVGRPGAAAEIRRPRPPARQHPLDRANDQVVSVA